MKKWHFARVFLLCLILLGTIAVLDKNVLADNSFYTTETSQEGIKYQLDTVLDTYTVIGYEGSDKNVVIPDKYNDKKVVGIGDTAFYGTNIKKVSIGKNVSEIGMGAFMSCRSLYQAVFKGKVDNVSDTMFYGCSKNKLTVVAAKGSAPYRYAKKHGSRYSTTSKIRLTDSRKKILGKGSFSLFLYNATSKVKWSSSKSSVAKVTSSGKVTCKKPGKATITATHDGKKYKCNITVLKRTRKNVLHYVYSTVISKKMSDYEKIKAAHKWLIQNVKYDKRLYTKGYVAMSSHTADGALVNGVAVCDGYSKAFMLIMEHYKIPCKMVTGGNHAWNIVKIRWYHIDCTYDDPIVNGSFSNTHVYTTYFLKTDSFMSKDHVWNKSLFPKCKSKKINKKYRTA